MLEAALSYARVGWRVQPLHNIGPDGFCTCRPSKTRPKGGKDCPSPGKHPRIKTGRAFEAATTDEAQIWEWWSKWPLANIGIATGQKSRLCVVDADSATGVGLLKSIADQHGGLPDTLISRTGRDGVGFHWWFTCDAPSPSNSGQGLDIRGDGGNLVAPPSMHASGRPYAWVNAVPPAPMPPWLLEWFQNRDRAEKEMPRKPSGPANLPQYLQGHTGANLGNRPTHLDLPAIADVESALEAIPNDNRSWDSWNVIGMAVWRATDGSEAGLEAFDYWSQKSRKYEPEAPEERWRAYVGSPPTELSFGTLWFEAKQANPSWQPPSQSRPSVIPLEMRPFAADQTRNNRSETLNGFHANGQSGVAQLFIPKDPDNPLIDLNKKHAVIGDIGGKCRVLSWAPSKVNPKLKVPTFRDFRAFSEWYGSQYINIRTLKKNGDVEDEAKQLGAYWLKWTERKSYEGIDLEPNAAPVLEGNILNLWSGYAVEPATGSWPLMQKHITQVLADGNADYAAYILRYAAWCLQNPGERAEVALVFRGEKGAGKGTFAHALKDIFGQHGLHISSSKHLTGNFNAHLRMCLLLFSDEAFWAGDKQGESTLKALLTEPTMMVELKGVDAAPWRNRLKIIMSANADWAVPASGLERRYAVFNVSNRHASDHRYFASLRAELASGGLAAMAHDLLALDLAGWHPRQIVKTAALLEQKRYSLSPLEEWFCSILENGVIPGGGSSDVVAVETLHYTFREGWPSARGSHEMIGKLLKKFGFQRVRDSRHNSRRFPPLADLRLKWEALHGGWTWEQDMAEWQTPTKARPAGIA